MNSKKKLEDNTKSDDNSGQILHSPSQLEVENTGDTSTEIKFNSLNDPPQPKSSVFDDGYCIYQTPTPNSRTFSAAIAQDGRNLPSRNQHPYPFGYVPVLVPGIVNYIPCWIPYIPFLRLYTSTTYATAIKFNADIISILWNVKHIGESYRRNVGALTKLHASGGRNRT